MFGTNGQLAGGQFSCQEIPIPCEAKHQASVSLSHGVGNLAQERAFARGGPLGIPYLLASRYFEHFLDTIFFVFFFFVCL